MAEKEKNIGGKEDEKNKKYSLFAC